MPLVATVDGVIAAGNQKTGKHWAESGIFRRSLHTRIPMEISFYIQYVNYSSRNRMFDMWLLQVRPGFLNELAHRLLIPNEPYLSI